MEHGRQLRLQVCHGKTFDVHPIPYLGVEQEPEPVAMVGAAPKVLGQHGLDRRRSQIPRLDQPGIPEIMAERRAELVPHEIRQGGGKALLGAPQDLGRDVALGQPHLDVAPPPATNLEGDRQGGGEMGQLVVQKG